MSAGPVTGHEMGHPLQPNTMLVSACPVLGLGAIPLAQCSLLLSQGDTGITESVYLTYAQSHLAKHQ